MTGLLRPPLLLSTPAPSRSWLQAGQAPGRAPLQHASPWDGCPCGPPDKTLLSPLLFPNTVLLHVPIFPGACYGDLWSWALALEVAELGNRAHIRVLQLFASSRINLYCVIVYLSL